MPHFLHRTPMVRRLSYGNSLFRSAQRGLQCTLSVPSVTHCPGRFPPFLQGGCRFLGNQVRGPSSFKDVLAHKQYAFDLLRAPGVTYDTFKQQCESLRLFLFVGVCGILSLDLFFRPPKSSYWKSWSCFQYLTQLRYQLFSGGAQSVFFNNRYRGSSEGWETYQSMVLKRSDSLSDPADGPHAPPPSENSAVSAPVPPEVPNASPPAPSAQTAQPVLSITSTNVSAVVPDAPRTCSETIPVLTVSTASLTTPSEDAGYGSGSGAPKIVGSDKRSLDVEAAPPPVAVAQATVQAINPDSVAVPPSNTLIIPATQC